MKHIYKTIIKILLLFLAFAVPWIAVDYFTNKIVAYEVFLNENCIAYVQDKIKVEELFNSYKGQLMERYGDIDLKEEFKYNKIFIDKEALSEEELIKNNMEASLDVEIDCYEMRINNKKVGTIIDKQQGEKVLEDIKKYYISKNKIGENELKKASIKEKITYVPYKTYLSNIMDLNNLYKSLINYNEKAKVPIINVEIIAQVKGTEKILPPISYVSSKELFLGERKVKSNGEEGVKEITKERVFNNSTKINEKNIATRTLKAPKEKIILTGTRNPIGASIAFLSSPSRGVITSSFGSRWGNENHHGIDIAGKIGDPIYASLEGTVLVASYDNIYGKYIKISHGGGIETLYGHCSSLLVKPGDKVKKGDLIGRVGNTGRSTGPHLHFELRFNGMATNPVGYIQ